MVESFDERYAKALTLKKVKQGAKWLATTPLVRQYVWMVDANPHANSFAANRIFQLKMAAWPNSDWAIEAKELNG